QLSCSRPAPTLSPYTTLFRSARPTSRPGDLDSQRVRHLLGRAPHRPQSPCWIDSTKLHTAAAAATVEGDQGDRGARPTVLDVVAVRWLVGDEDGVVPGRSEQPAPGPVLAHLHRGGHPVLSGALPPDAHVTVAEHRAA